jgi:hypothetical protein
MCRNAYAAGVSRISHAAHVAIGREKAAKQSFLQGAPASAMPL